MTEEERLQAMREWMESRPERVRKLAAEFPLGYKCKGSDGEVLHLMGWTENDHLILSPIDPAADYQAANSTRIYACAKHYRPGGAGTCSHN